MEGLRRALVAFKMHPLKRLWYKLVYKYFEITKIDKILFKDKILSVEQAVDPELLIW
jgi:hypothetical protein